MVLARSSEHLECRWVCSREGMLLWTRHYLSTSRWGWYYHVHCTNQDRRYLWRRSRPWRQGVGIQKPWSYMVPVTCYIVMERRKESEGTLWHRLLGASAYPVSILPSFCTSTAYLTLEANRLCWKYSLPYTAYDQFLWGRSKHLCIDFAFCKTYCFSEKQRTSAGTDVFPFLFSFFLSGMELSPGRDRAAYCAFITGHSMLRMAGKKDRESLVPF